jgi:hypothetical protein
MGTFVRSGATALERLLRRLELPEVGADAGLYRLIEGLTKQGLGDSGVRALDDLDHVAVAALHEPADRPYERELVIATYDYFHTEAARSAYRGRSGPEQKCGATTRSGSARTGRRKPPVKKP